MKLFTKEELEAIELDVSHVVNTCTMDANHLKLRTSILNKIRKGEVITKKDNSKDNVLGKEIKRLRELNKLTQVGFSKTIGVSQTALSFMESGLSFPRRSTIKRMEEEFDCEFNIELITK